MSCSNHPDRENVAFCQNCGKPLCQECTRVVGSAVFCEPCLAGRLAGAPPASGPIPGSPSQPGAPADAAWQWGAGTPPGWQPGPGPGPNPSLAALLGFIPGVGAMYNGQYAKGVVHLIVFAILVSLADQHGIFGLFIAGWVCYQVIDAYHTARARRDGTPLPNPFGLNDLGERLGFGKAWPSTAPTAQQAPSATPPSDPYTAPPSAYTPPSAAAWSTPYSYSAPPVPPVSPYAPPIAPLEPLPVPRNRFPAGALWLIGLGCLFLIGNAGLFHTFPVHRIVPFVLIGFGVWLFVRKMTDSGTGLVDDGTPGYQFRLFRALRGSVWIVLVGVLFFLDSWGILSWSRSWPLLIITAGLMAVFQRISYHTAMAGPYAYPYPQSPPVTPPSPPGPETPDQDKQEGR